MKKIRILLIMAVLTICFLMTACEKNNSDTSDHVQRERTVTSGNSGTEEQSSENSSVNIASDSAQADGISDGTAAADIESRDTTAADPETTPTPIPTPTPFADMRTGTYDPDTLMLFDTDVRGGMLTGNFVPCYALSCDEIGFEDIAFAKNSGIDPAELQDDYSVYRFILKKGLTFRDGAEITIDDALYSLGTVCRGTYSGESTVPSAGIYGMRAYSMQMTDYRYELYKAALNAGIAKDGTIPEVEGYTEAELKEVWDCLDEAGSLFAQNIIDYIIANYRETTWVHTFMSSNLSFSEILENESLKTVYAFIMWGYGAEYSPYSYWSHIFTDKNGTKYNLDAAPLTSHDLWNVLFRYYGFDLSDTGINYEKPATCTERIEDLLWKVYYDRYSTKILSIPGILKGTVTGDDGQVRSCIYVIIRKDSDIAKFNFAIWDRRGVG